MKKKILVIDDDSNVRDYLFSLFTTNGYEVCVAKNSKQGLAKAEKIIPDLITLDIEMPDEWGPRFYHQLSQNPDLKAIPVIVISGLPGHEYTILKAAASISKPFDRDQLLKIVEKTLA